MAEPRYRMVLEGDDLVCTDLRTGKPVALDRCTRIALDPGGGIRVAFDKRRCGWEPHTRAELVERIKTVGSVWAEEEAPRRRRKKKAV